MMLSMPVSITARPVPPAMRQRIPPVAQADQSALNFLTDDPLVPLPVIDLEPLPVDNETETMTELHAGYDLGDVVHVRPGLILDVRV
ncbi:MAG TPA: hypothetical protein VL625_09660 [Patescibacteria group bacterium]|jgi:hypothetical protein|nr:hypothetical protein [Patescibacteria group bacterium]